MDNSIEPEPQVSRSTTIKDHEVNDKDHLNHAGIDQAYSYMQHAQGSGIVEKSSPAEIKRLRRKIDWWIVPVMFCCYTMQFIDKVSLNVGTNRLSIAKAFS